MIATLGSETNEKKKKKKILLEMLARELYTEERLFQTKKLEEEM